jgi:hypothetical protein
LEEISLDKMKTFSDLRHVIAGSKIPTDIIDEEFFLILKEESAFFDRNQENEISQLVEQIKRLKQEPKYIHKIKQSL